MGLKSNTVNVRMNESELKMLKANAEKEKVSVSQYVRSRACGCGESGYEGIFSQVTWRCGKCGKTNVWRKNEKPN
jgi:hypothetical protein